MNNQITCHILFVLKIKKRNHLNIDLKIIFFRKIFTLWKNNIIILYIKWLYSHYDKLKNHSNTIVELYRKNRRIELYRKLRKRLIFSDYTYN